MIKSDQPSPKKMKKEEVFMQDLKGSETIKIKLVFLCLVILDFKKYIIC
jgi:hypothetical protein